MLDKDVIDFIFFLQVFGEIQEIVKIGLWVGDCFIYISFVNRLNYYVGGEIVMIVYLDRQLIIVLFFVLSILNLKLCFLRKICCRFVVMRGLIFQCYSFSRLVIVN